MKVSFSALNKHLKNTEFWFDIILLSILWIVVFILPGDTIILNVKVTDILKIIALISSLEAFGFFMNLLFDRKNSLLFQGFFGGLISSTMTYLRFTTGSEAIKNPKTVSQALILATIAMLIEGALIVAAIHPKGVFLISPFLIQVGLLVLAVILLGKNQNIRDELHLNKLNLKEPIIWKKVLYFSSFIVGLIYLQQFINRFMPSSYIWTSFIVSLFEAHAVLAAAMTEFQSLGKNQEVNLVILAVLTGNVISKSFFVLRSRNRVIIRSVLIPLYISLAVAIVVTIL